MTKFVFNPLLDRSGIVKLLEAENTGTKHPFEGALLSSLDSNVVQEALEAASNYLSTISYDDAVRLGDQYLGSSTKNGTFKAFVSHLITPVLYELNMAESGDHGDISVASANNPPDNTTANDAFALVATNKGAGTYFDLSAYMVKDGQVTGLISYSEKDNRGLLHSGDKGSLLHFIKKSSDLEDETYIILTVVGYQTTPLAEFNAQQPMVYLVDPKSASLILIPCPLELAQIGSKTTLAGLVALKYEKAKNSMQYYVLPQQAKVPNVNTNDFSLETKTAMIEAARQAKLFFERLDNDQSLPTQPSNDGSGSPSSNSSVVMDNLTASTHVNFVENGLQSTLSEKQGTMFASFGTGLDFSNKFVFRNPDQVNLPMLWGLCENAAALALGEKSNITLGSDDYHHILQDKKLIVVDVSADKWFDSVRSSCKTTANAVYILHAPENTPAGSIDGLCRNAFCMAGPNSIKLVEINGRHYFYGGVRWPGLLDELPERNGEIPDFKSKLIDWAAQGGMKQVPWPLIYKLGSKQIFYNGEMKKVDQVIESIAAMTSAERTENRLEIFDVLTQIESALPPNEFSEVRTIITNLLQPPSTGPVTTEDTVLHDRLQGLVSERGGATRFADAQRRWRRGGECEASSAASSSQNGTTLYGSDVQPSVRGGGGSAPFAGAVLGEHSAVSSNIVVALERILISYQACHSINPKHVSYLEALIKNFTKNPGQPNEYIKKIRAYMKMGPTRSRVDAALRALVTAIEQNKVVTNPSVLTQLANLAKGTDPVTRCNVM